MAGQDYAFFAGQRAARTALRSLRQPGGRCALRELPVPSTRTHLAFPLPNRSPYAKPTLLRSNRREEKWRAWVSIDGSYGKTKTKSHEGRDASEGQNSCR
ncbi:hypothetical protein EVAR_89054_1 [Eumeta japonica]|uniref:Uncharacterized protein n=1 Tax=Eumeta variegata TaxID=151549 RepID=A0A4C1XL64_EUMVA|nr:hypothetical protein EVAR_89054_1 [Eumeta japonica]